MDIKVSGIDRFDCVLLDTSEIRLLCIVDSGLAACLLIQDTFLQVWRAALYII